MAQFLVKDLTLNDYEKAFKLKKNTLKKKDIVEIKRKLRINKLNITKKKNETKNEYIDRLTKNYSEYKKILKKQEKDKIKEEKVKIAKELNDKGEVKTTYKKLEKELAKLRKENGNVMDYIGNTKYKYKVGKVDITEMYISKYAGTLLKRFEASGILNEKMFYDTIEQINNLYSQGDYAFQYLKIYYKYKGETKYLFRMVHANVLFDYDTFKEDVSNITNSLESHEGSDKIDTDYYELSYDHFELLYLYQKYVAGIEYNKTDDINVFKYVDNGYNDKEKGFCSYYCLKYFGFDVSKDMCLNLSLNKLVMETSKTNTEIIDSKLYFKLYNIDKKEYIQTIINKKKIPFYKFKESDYIFRSYSDIDDKEKSVYIRNKSYEEIKNKKIIVYHNNHVDCIEGDILKNIKYDFYRDLAGNIYYKNGDEYINYSNNPYKEHKDRKKKLIDTDIKIQLRYLVFDFETVIDWTQDNVNIPYSVAFTDYDSICLEQLESAENKIKTINKLEKEINSKKNKTLLDENILEKYKKEREMLIYNCENENTHFYSGFDCCDRLLEYIESQKDVRYVLISFNGANFDNYILYNHVIKKYSKERYGNLLLAKGQLLNFKLFGLHTFFDVRKFVVGSLSSCCTNFGIEIFSKVSTYNHNTVQEAYNNNKLTDYLKDNHDNIRYYNIYDCISLSLLYYRFKQSLINISHKVNDKEIYVLKDELHNFSTLGMLIKNWCVRIWEAKDIKIPKYCISLNDFKNTFVREKVDNKDIKLKYDKYCGYLEQAYNDTKVNRIAGRVELINGPQIVNNRTGSIDMCSEYPFVMGIAKVYYPTGIHIFDKRTNINKILENDNMGFYYCRVDQSHLGVKILAQKTKENNNWKCDIIENILISKEMIRFLLKYNCKVSINTVNGLTGWYFTEKIKSCELFSFILDVMKYKNEQDELKKKNHPAYNNAIREVYKLIMNIMSGKINQDLNREVREIKDLDTYFREMEDSEVESKLIHISGNNAHIVYKKEIKDCIKKASPLCIGTMIYEYARMTMYEHLYSKIPKEFQYYTDTDSLKMHYEAFKKWVETYASKTFISHWPEVEKYEPKYKDHKIFEYDSKILGSFEDEYGDNSRSIFLQPKFYGTNTSKYSFHAKGVKDQYVILNNDTLDKYNIKTPIEMFDLYTNPNKYECKRIKDDYEGFLLTFYENRTATLLGWSISKEYNNNKQEVHPKFDGDTRYLDKVNDICYNTKTNYRLKTVKF